MTTEPGRVRIISKSGTSEYSEKSSKNRLDFVAKRTGRNYILYRRDSMVTQYFNAPLGATIDFE